MKKCYFIKLTTTNGSFVENETGEVFSEEEAIDIIIQEWNELFQDHYSWDLEKIIYKYY